jgi:hypothetical protein
MTTSYPQEPADEIHSILEEAERRFAREVETLNEERKRLIAEGWLRTCLHLPSCAGPSAV